MPSKCRCCSTELAAEDSFDMCEPGVKCRHFVRQFQVASGGDCIVKCFLGIAVAGSCVRRGVYLIKLVIGFLAQSLAGSPTLAHCLFLPETIVITGPDLKIALIT